MIWLLWYLCVPCVVVMALCILRLNNVTTVATAPPPEEPPGGGEPSDPLGDGPPDTVDWDDLADQIRLYGYTHCPDLFATRGEP